MPSGSNNDDDVDTRWTRPGLLPPPAPFIPGERSNLFTYLLAFKLTQEGRERSAYTIKGKSVPDYKKRRKKELNVTSSHIKEIFASYLYFFSFFSFFSRCIMFFFVRISFKRIAMSFKSFQPQE